ncbi:MAG: hypothetical protein OXG78_07510 [Chloroflexi bacterium]|nr:hypothetical protein [Chloroflexota bacterium]
MTILVFFVFNLLLMGAVFLYGMYQFMQVEEKRKRRKLLAQAALDETELSALIQAERYDEALARLMRGAQVDRFSAESALEQWTNSAQTPQDPRATPRRG